MGEVDFLCNDNLSIKSSIKYLPIYMIMFIYRETRQCPILIRPQRVKLDRVREIGYLRASLNPSFMPLYELVSPERELAEDELLSA